MNKKTNYSYDLQCVKNIMIKTKSNLFARILFHQIETLIYEILQNCLDSRRMATSIGGILINVHFFLLFYNDVNFKYFFLAFVIIFFTFHITLTPGLTVVTDGRSCWVVERTSKINNLFKMILLFYKEEGILSYIDFILFFSLKS